QARDPDVKSCVRERIRFCDTRCDPVHLGLSLRNAHAVFKTPDRFKAMILARVYLRGDRQWYPEFRFFRKPKTAWHHTNDCARSTTDHHFPTKNVLIAAEISLPQIVSENHDAIFFGSILVHRESAPELRPHVEHFE